MSAPRPQGITHLVFDFFGTLVDYSPSRTAQGYPDTWACYRRAGGELAYAPFVEAWARAFARLDDATRESRREYSMLEVARALLDERMPAADEDLAAELAARYLAEWSRGIRAIDGVAAMLARLARHLDLSIITNTHDAALVPRQLERLGLAPLFSQVATSVELGWRKPHTALFAHALDGLGAAPERCAYVGDSLEHDHGGARAAGLQPLLIDPDGTAPVPARERLASILELEDALASSGRVVSGGRRGVSSRVSHPRPRSPR